MWNSNSLFVLCGYCHRILSVGAKNWKCTGHLSVHRKWEDPGHGGSCDLNRSRASKRGTGNSVSQHVCVFVWAGLKPAYERLQYEVDKTDWKNSAIRDVMAFAIHAKGPLPPMPVDQLTKLSKRQDIVGKLANLVLSVPAEES